MHHIFGEALRIRVKKFKQNFTENYSKTTKIAIEACTFLKISGGAYPRTSREPFPLLKILATRLSAVYQHLPNEVSKFHSEVAIKDSQDCDATL